MLENARWVWLRFVEKNRRDVEEKSEQLKAGGLLRTSTRPTVNLLHLLRASVCTRMNIHTEGESCSDLGRVLVMNDSTASTLKVGVMLRSRSSACSE